MVPRAAGVTRGIASRCACERAHWPVRTTERLTQHTVADLTELTQQLDDIRAGGFAYDREEHALGRCAIGLPVGVHQGVLLAISVVMPSQRFERQRGIVEQAARHRH